MIHKHFYLKRVEVMAQCEEWIADIQQYSSDKRVGRTMSHHAAALKVNKHYSSTGDLALYQNFVLLHRSEYPIPLSLIFIHTVLVKEV